MRGNKACLRRSGSGSSISLVSKLRARIGFTFEIIDQAEESPVDQDSGDFWGLYLAVENVDEHFLKEHALPAGNLYKIEGGAKTAFNGNPAVTNQSDVRQFMKLERAPTVGVLVVDERGSSALLQLSFDP